MKDIIDSNTLGKICDRIRENYCETGRDCETCPMNTKAECIGSMLGESWRRLKNAEHSSKHYMELWYSVEDLCADLQSAREEQYYAIDCLNTHSCDSCPASVDGYCVNLTLADIIETFGKEVTF